MIYELFSFNVKEGWVTGANSWDAPTHISVTSLDSETVAIVADNFPDDYTTTGLMFNFVDPSKTSGYMLIKITGLKLNLSLEQEVSVPLKAFTLPKKN